MFVYKIEVAASAVWLIKCFAVVPCYYEYSPAAASVPRFYDKIGNVFDYIKKVFNLELAINRPYIFGGRYTVLYGKFFVRNLSSTSG